MHVDDDLSLTAQAFMETLERRAADGLAALGFPVVATDKTSKLYRLSDMPAMLAAMVKHIQAVQEKQAA